MMQVHGPGQQRDTTAGRGRDAALCGAALAGALLLLPQPSQAGEPLPRPKVAYHLTAKGPQGAGMTIAHSGERMRLEVSQSDIPGDMTGIVDLARKRMLMLVAIPGMGNRAFDIDLPDDFAALDPGGEGARVGTDKVAGETCHLWRTREEHSGTPVEACITEDGITLRAKAEVSGRSRVLFEAVKLVRAPQDAQLFELPPGVKVTRLPAGMESMVPGLPGLLR